VPDGAAQVLVAGQDQGLDGPVGCATADGIVTMTIGQAPNVIAVVLRDADPPQVITVVMLSGPTTLEHHVAGTPGSAAQAIRADGLYTVVGTVVDLTNQTPPKPFQIAVACD
jgi:hypothetical protein